MKTKVIFFAIFMAYLGTQLAYAQTSITTNKENYAINEQISINYTEMAGNTNDWFAIYPHGSSTDWVNVIEGGYWQWTNTVINGTHTFNSLPAGSYEIRAFFNDTFIEEASHGFTVGVPPSMTANKDNYLENEPIVINFDNMLGDEEDWIGIYPIGSSNAWENMIEWDFTKGNTNGRKTGEITLNALPLGNYEIRAFFQNSFTHVVTYQINVVNPVILSLENNYYTSDDDITVYFENMEGTALDWIALFKKNDLSHLDYLLRWARTASLTEGNTTIISEGNIPAGEYEIRAFFNDSYNEEASIPLTIQAPLSLSLTQESYSSSEQISINFENMEGNITDWIAIYPVGAESEPFSNVLRWTHTNGLKNGTVNFDSLPTGEYEIRGFFHNSYNSEFTQSFNVSNSSKTCSNLNNVEPCSVSTFHNLSLYWSPLAGDVNKKVSIEYALQGTKEWKKAQNLVYNPITSSTTYTYPSSSPANPRPHIQVNANDVVSKADYRGSIVNLAPNSAYSIKLTLENGETKTIDANTWSENFPIAQTYTIDNGGCQNYNVGDETCTVNKEGSKENGYIVIDGENQTLKNIELTGKSYIILRNFKLLGAAKNAIYLPKNSHHIVIEDCDISAWGRISSKKRFDGAVGTFAEFGEEDPAILCEFNLSSSVMQRNKIYNPSYGTNSWAEAHGRVEITLATYNAFLANNPNNISIAIDNGKYYKENHHAVGPQAISFWYSEKGNNVIRYNEIYATNNNYLYDPLGGAANMSYHGFPGADSDIYGNYIANAWDDAIEVEGGGENVRVWHNYIEKTYIAIANAVTSVGPLYIWRNVSGKAGEMIVDNNKKLNKLNLALYASFLKMGFAGNISFMTGNIHVYNNTILNVNNDGYGGLGTTLNNNRIMRNIKTRNNILHVRVNGVNSISRNTDNQGVDPATTNEDYGFDMVNPEVNQILRVPSFYNNNRIEAIPEYDVAVALSLARNGNFKLTAGNIGLNRGECIPNIIPLKTPDIGVQDSSIGSMQFGTTYNFSTPNSYEECN